MITCPRLRKMRCIRLGTGYRCVLIICLMYIFNLQVLNFMAGLDEDW